MNNKTLAITFVVLLGIYLISKLFSGNRERSFDPDILALDTAAVSKLVIHPAQSGAQFELSKSGSNWSIKQNEKEYTASPGSVQGLLSGVAKLTADRAVTKNRERHKDYAVDQESGTRIEIFQGAKKTGDLVIGRFNFNQMTRSGVSYVRKFDEDPVYSIEGFLSMTLAQGMDSYRNKMVLSLNTQDLTKITLRGTSGEQIIMKSDSTWFDQTNSKLDSATITGYLSGLQSVMGNTFMQQQSDLGDRLMTLQLEGNNIAPGLEINCYQSRDTSQHFIIHSTQNAEGYFFSDSVGIFNRLFSAFPGRVQ